MLNNYPLMFCFVGEQPIANLIPIKHLNPDKVLFWITKRTEKVSESLNNIIGKKGVIKNVDPYNITKITNTLMDEVRKNKGDIDNSKIAFNLTGGTKPMAFAGLFICQKYKIPFCYLQSEGGQSILYTYRWEQNQLMIHERKILPDSICLDEYIKLHIGGEYHPRNNTEIYEKIIFNCLKDEVNEIKNNIYLKESLEVDLIFRLGNQVGIAEIKTGNKARTKVGIDHLITAGGREYLGTYTKKFYIADREYPENNKDLANARNVIVIELKNSKNIEGIQKLNKKDQKFLVNTIIEEMQK